MNRVGYDTIKEEEISFSDYVEELIGSRVICLEDDTVEFNPSRLVHDSEAINRDQEQEQNTK